MPPEGDIPKWLHSSEEYLPTKSQDAFIDKGILALFGLLAKLRPQDDVRRVGFGVNVFSRLLFTLLLVLLVSLSRSPAFILIVITYLLLVLAVMPPNRLRSILAVSFTAAFVCLLVMLPSAFLGNRYSLVILPIKMFITVAAVNILTQTAKPGELVDALKRFHLPDIFIFILDITIRYILMLGEFTLEMMYALRLRSVGKSRSGKDNTSSLSGIAGTMFIKSREMAEELEGAMECRGFTGEYKATGTDKLRLSLADGLYVVFNLALLSAFIVLWV